MNVALLSDIHGNSPALQAVLNDIQRAHCAEVFMLGDIINGIDPQGCVQMLRAWTNANNVKLSCIKGNAEAYLTTPDRAALPKHDEALNRGLIPLIQWFEDHLSTDDLAWIRTWPDTLRWNDVYLVHDSPHDRLAAQMQADPDIKPEHREWFYHGRGIHFNMAEQEWRELLEYMEQEHLLHVFSGHTHTPFCRAIGDKIICNVGSAGLPFDGDPRPSWVLLEITPAGKHIISIRRVTYDISLIHQLIDDTPDYTEIRAHPGFREAYKKWFATGRYWKSCG